MKRPYKALFTLETIVADFGDSRRIRRLVASVDRRQAIIQESIPLFIALFGRVCIVHVAGRHESITAGKHGLRPTTAQYFWLHPRYCGYNIHVPCILYYISIATFAKCQHVSDTEHHYPSLQRVQTDG